MQSSLPPSLFKRAAQRQLRLRFSRITFSGASTETEQSVSDIPSADEWTRSRVPVFGPNSATVYAWTNTEIDNAYLFSSRPALVHVPTALSLPTGGTFNNRSETTYQIDENTQPTEVTIHASSAMHHLTSADIERKIMVYPRQFIQGFSLKPQKSEPRIPAIR